MTVVYSFTTDTQSCTCGELFSLFVNLSSACLSYRPQRDRDVFGNKVLPTLRVQDGVLALRFEGASDNHLGPFASYPFKIKKVSEAQHKWLLKLPKGVSLGEYVGDRGRKRVPKFSLHPRTFAKWRVALDIC
jgi:hypothetical protein